MANRISRENGPRVVDQDEIARCAYAIWESEGRPEGRAVEHWFEAESQLRMAAESAADTTRPARPRKPATREPAPVAAARFETIR